MGAGPGGFGPPPPRLAVRPPVHERAAVALLVVHNGRVRPEPGGLPLRGHRLVGLGSQACPDGRVAGEGRAARRVIAGRRKPLRTGIWAAPRPPLTRPTESETRMPDAEHYDVLIIGAGLAGLPLARQLLLNL